MDKQTSDLHMLRFRVRLPRLFELARRRNLSRATGDTGYLVHCLLGELFGEGAPKPFHLIGRGGSSRGGRDWQEILAYSVRGEKELREYASTFADPGNHAAIDWPTFAGKSLPRQWPAGQRLGFEVRLCPVVRKSCEESSRRRIVEMDAYQSYRMQLPEGQSEPDGREQIYRRWLAERAELRAARLVDMRMIQSRRIRLLRRKKNRAVKQCERPDVTMRGQLEVVDGEAFSSLLARGIGRHRAFGFGMLLLKPPTSGAC